MMSSQKHTRFIVLFSFADSDSYLFFISGAPHDFMTVCGGVGLSLKHKAATPVGDKCPFYAAAVSSQTDLTPNISRQVQ